MKKLCSFLFVGIITYAVLITNPVFSLADDEDFIPLRPEDLFDDVYVPGFNIRNYDIHPDGTRFLMIKEIKEQEQAPITELIVVENWSEELKRRASTGNN